MNNYLLLTQKYFQAFADKNISALSAMFTDDITLTDWTARFSGRESVLQFNIGLFDVMSSIMVIPHKLAVTDSTVFAQISVMLTSADNKTVTLNVVDIIEYRDNKIASIRAYKC